MSLTTTTPLLTIPASDPGVLITGAAGHWTSGAWIEVFAVSPVTIQIAGVELSTFGAGSAANNLWSLQLAIGAAGAEVQVAEYLFYWGNSGANDDRALRFPCPFNGVPFASRLAARLRNLASAAVSLNTVVLYYRGLNSDHSLSSPLQFMPAVDTGTGLLAVALTPNGTAFANSAYIELTSGIANEIALASVVLESSLATVIEWEIDIATGGAGSETVITTLRETSPSTSQGSPKAVPLPALYPIALNTRVAARIRKTGTSTATHTLGVNYYGPTTILGAPPPSGGGTPPVGTDPAAGTSLCGTTAPVTVWAELELDASTVRYSLVDQPLNHPTTYQGGPKEPRLLAIGALSRSLSDWTGNFVVGSTTITLEDTDHVIRGLARSNTLLNKHVSMWMIDDVSARAGSVPFRVGNFLVSDYEPVGDLSFILTLIDPLGSTGSSLNLTKMVPPLLFDAVAFPNLPSSLLNKAIPIPYGILTDETPDPYFVSPQGVVPVTFVGQRVMADGNTWYEGVIAGCATKGPISVFGSSGGTPPTRIKLDAALYTTDIAFPGQGQWTTVTGTAALYIVWNSHRYTTIYFKPGSAVGEAFKDGSVPVAVNLGGIEDVGDGTGTVISSLPRQMVHFLINFVIQQPPGNANWQTIPSIGSPSYSIISTTTFETVKTASEARLSGGYKGNFLIGWDLNQVTTAQQLARMCQSGDFNIFVNRHGQICASMQDASAAVVKSFLDITDVVKGSFHTKKDRTKWANAAAIQTLPQMTNPVTSTVNTSNQVIISGATTPTGSFKSGWAVSDPTQIAAQRDSQLYQFQDWITIDYTVLPTPIPVNVLAYILDRMKLAPEFTTFDVDLCGLDLELGNNYNITHFAGVVSTVRKLRLFTIALDVKSGRVTLTGHDLTDL